MSSPAHRRTATIVTTAAMLVAGGMLIAWDALRPATATGSIRRQPPVPRGAAAIDALLRDPRFVALVLLAPAPTPSAMGNANPFGVPPSPVAEQP